ncbi:PhzF family phenazine biosynthesis protein [Oceanithermus desulfurans]
MSLLFGVDAFTDRPFAGNPAAVCVLASPADPAWMQALAAEMNLSETAFLWPEGGAWRLRWFTPKVEVDLCGHATLASAHVLWRHLERSEPRLVFETRSGRLFATRDGERIGLDFPAPEAVAASLPDEIAAALGGVRPVWSGRAEDDWIVVLESAAAVRTLAPDPGLLARAPARGVVVTARDESGAYDVVSRFFAPAVGVDEDPVTGSAHARMARYWAGVLGRERLRAYQASPRGGALELELRGDRVLLWGRAVTVWSGRVAAASG